MSTTLRKELDAARFDWATCDSFVVQAGAEDDNYAYCERNVYQSGGDWSFKPPEEMPLGDAKANYILDLEFDKGFGLPEMPRFCARDKSFIYFATQYDGATSVAKCPRSPQYYLHNPDSEIFYP